MDGENNISRPAMLVYERFMSYQDFDYTPENEHGT